MRLFLALPLPPHIAWSIHQTVEDLPKDVPGLRLVPPQNYHLTVLFLGWVKETRLPKIKSSINDVLRVTNYELRLTTDHPVLIPSRTAPRILALSLTGDLDPFVQLQTTLRQTFDIESNMYPPHLTLARFKKGTKLSLPQTKRLLNLTIKSSTITTTELILYQSILKRPHPTYQPLATFPL